MTFKKLFIEEELIKLGLNERQLKAADFVKEKGFITNRVYQRLTKVSKITSTRDLTNLVKKVFSKK